MLLTHSSLPPYHPQTGAPAGFATEFLGLLCEHPLTNPKAVSLTAALNALLQLGSLSSLVIHPHNQAYLTNLLPPLVLLKYEQIS